MNFDFSPLRKRVTDRDISEYTDYVNKTTPQHSAPDVRKRLMSVKTEALVEVGLIVCFFASSLLGDTDIGVGIGEFLLVAAVILWPGVIITLHVEHRFHQVALYGSVRLYKFAKRNGIWLYPQRLLTDDMVGYDGSIFDVKQQYGTPYMINRSLLQTLYIDNGVKLANYYCRVTQDPPSISNGRNNTYVDAWGFVRVPLNYTYPHLYANVRDDDATPIDNFLYSPKSEGGFAPVQLEGDFYKYYTIRAPEGEESNAYYVFTPDFMEDLMKLEVRYGMEVMSDHLLIYRSGMFNFTNEDELKRLFLFINTVDHKLNRRRGDFQLLPIDAKETVKPLPKKKPDIGYILFLVILGIEGLIVVIGFVYVACGGDIEDLV